MKKLSPILFIFFLILGSFFSPIYPEEWNKERNAKITTKLDVENFWKQVKKTREIKYGKDSALEIDFDFCSNWSSKIDISKGEGLMTKYVLGKE